MENQSGKLAFNEFQIDYLIDFFDDLEKLKFTWNNKEISINPNKCGADWAFNMDKYIPRINEAFNQNLDKLKYLNQLVENFNASNVYPIKESKKTVTDCIAKLSGKYGFENIPLVYSTCSKQSVGTCFAMDDFRHIDFINSLIIIGRKKIIKIKRIEILNLDGTGLTISVLIDYLKPQRMVKVALFISNTKGIYIDKSGVAYEIENSSRRFKIVKNLRTKPKSLKTLAHLLNETPERNVQQDIRNINLIFKKKLDIEEKLIINSGSSGYVLNTDVFEITFTK